MEKADKKFLKLLIFLELFLVVIGIRFRFEYFLINFVVILLVYTILLLITNKLVISLAITTILSCFIVILDNIKRIFWNSPLNIYDIFYLSESFATKQVVKNYFLNFGYILGIAIFILFSFFLAKRALQVRSDSVIKFNRKWYKVTYSLLTCVMIFFSWSALMNTNPSLHIKHFLDNYHVPYGITLFRRKPKGGIFFILGVSLLDINSKAQPSIGSYVVTNRIQTNRNNTKIQIPFRELPISY